MSYTITVVPASTQAGRETIRALLADESQPVVRAIYRDLTKAPPEFTSNSNLIAIKGDIATGAGLEFAGSDAVFYIPPPPYDAGTIDVSKFATAAANRVKSAIEAAPSVKRLVLLSALGSEHDHSIGLLKINHISDKILRTAAPEAAIVRSGYFHESWARALETAKAEPPVFYSVLTPIDHRLPMVGLADIGRVCARKLLDLTAPLPERTEVVDLFGPRHYSTRDIQQAVETVMGKKVEVILVEKEKLGEYYAGKVPEGLVGEMVEFTRTALPGGIMAEGFDGGQNAVWGEVELVDALRKIYAA